MTQQGPYGMGGGSWGDPSKASSAFSPINSGVGLPTSTGLSLLNPPCQHHHYPLRLHRVQHGRRRKGLSLLRPHLIPKTKPGLWTSVRNSDVESFNPFKVELKRLYFIQLPLSPPLVGSPNSHAQRRVKQRFRKVYSS